MEEAAYEEPLSPPEGPTYEYRAGFGYDTSFQNRLMERLDKHGATLLAINSHLGSISGMCEILMVESPILRLILLVGPESTLLVARRRILGLALLGPIFLIPPTHLPSLISLVSLLVFLFDLFLFHF